MDGMVSSSTTHKHLAEIKRILWRLGHHQNTSMMHITTHPWHKRVILICLPTPTTCMKHCYTLCFCRHSYIHRRVFIVYYPDARVMTINGLTWAYMYTCADFGEGKQLEGSFRTGICTSCQCYSTWFLYAWFLGINTSMASRWVFLRIICATSVWVLFRTYSPLTKYRYCPTWDKTKQEPSALIIKPCLENLVLLHRDLSTQKMTSPKNLFPTKIVKINLDLFLRILMCKMDHCHEPFQISSTRHVFNNKK